MGPNQLNQKAMGPKNHISKAMGPKMTISQLWGQINLIKRPWGRIMGSMCKINNFQGPRSQQQHNFKKARLPITIGANSNGAMRQLQFKISAHWGQAINCDQKFTQFPYLSRRVCRIVNSKGLGAELSISKGRCQFKATSNFKKEEHRFIIINLIYW